MDSNILDSEWQKVVAIKNLFDSPGWVIFEEKIKDYLECEKAKLEEHLNNFISHEKLDELNISNVRKQCFESILRIKEELLEEFENSPAQDSSDGEQNTSENK